VPDLERVIKLVVGCGKPFWKSSWGGKGRTLSVRVLKSMREPLGEGVPPDEGEY